LENDARSRRRPAGPVKDFWVRKSAFDGNCLGSVLGGRRIPKQKSPRFAIVLNEPGKELCSVARWTIHTLGYHVRKLELVALAITLIGYALA
jgi:hypothetical protein